MPQTSHLGNQYDYNIYPYPQDTPRPYRNTLEHASADTGSGNAAGEAESAISPLDSLSIGLIQGHPLMAGNSLSQLNLSWPNVDPMITIPTPAGNESRMSQSNFASQSCTCNSATRPCPDHLEKIRAQVLAGACSPLPLHQQLQNHHSPYPDMSVPHQPPHRPLHWYNSSGSRYVLPLFTTFAFRRPLGLGVSHLSQLSQLITLSLV